MKKSELRQIIKEEINKILNENDNNTAIYKSKVDWYYIEEYSDYPGPKGRVVPNASGYDNPKKYKGTELYIKKGTEGQIYNNQFEDEEGNTVPFESEYFVKN